MNYESCRSVKKTVGLCAAVRGCGVTPAGAIKDAAAIYRIELGNYEFSAVAGNSPKVL